MKHRLLVTGVFSLIVVFSGVPGIGDRAALGQCRYSVTWIDVPDELGGDGDASATDINDEGQVCGVLMSSVIKAFRWGPKDGFQLLPIPKDSEYYTYAFDLNNAGDVGIYTEFIQSTGSLSQDYPGFVYSKGQMHRIPLLIANEDIGTSIPRLNNVGQIAFSQGNMNVLRTFIWSIKTGVVAEIQGSEATAIDDLGTVVFNGSSCWNGGFTTLPRPAGSSSISVRGLDDHGAYCGFAEFAQKPGQPTLRRAAVWSQGDVRVIDPLPGFKNSAATDMNSRGEIVGRMSGTSPTCLFIITGGELHCLDELLDSSTPAVRYGFIPDIVINEHGVLCARGVPPGQTSVATCILTPIDPPQADVDGDCDVDIDDLSHIVLQWDRADSFADIDDDGVVGSGDLSLIFEQWTE